MRRSPAVTSVTPIISRTVGNLHTLGRSADPPSNYRRCHRAEIRLGHHRTRADLPARPADHNLRGVTKMAIAAVGTPPTGFAALSRAAVARAADLVQSI